MDFNQQNEQNQPMEEMEVAPAEEKKAYNWKRELWEWTQAILIAFVLAFVIRTFFFELVRVEGASMEPTLHTGERLFVNRFLYEPENGDIVVFTPERYSNKPYIKRVIATEGQTVNIDYTTGNVWVDGELLDEPYIKVPTTFPGDVQFPVTVPEGYFFAMGDNRGNSHDSRNSDVGDVDNRSGLVSEERIRGKAMFRIWPLSEFGSLYK